MITRIIISSFFFLGSHFCYSQPIDTAKLNSYFKNLETHEKFMGSVAVSRDGQLLYTNSIGYADVEARVPANTNSKYRIGSITKTFTTVLAFMAMEKGRLDFNQTLDKYFPSVPNADKITISQLLYHRTGIHDFTEDTDYMGWLNQPKSKDEMIEIIKQGGSDFDPDSKARYSNSNFYLLTYILEDIYQQTYPVMLKENILDPVGLKNTYYGGVIDAAKNETYSYSFVNGWQKEPETDMSIPLGAGGIVSTPLDLIRFGDALFSGKLISASGLDQMKTLKDYYGMGLFQVPFGEKKGYGHTGGIDGFSAALFYFPEDKVSFAMTSNGSNFNNNDISIAVLSSVFDRPYEIPVFTTFSVSSENLDPFLGVYASQQIPIKITISKIDNLLFAQATGQPSFPLEATSPSTFKFDKAGVVLEFNASEKTMLLKQSGQEFSFKME